MDEHECYNFKQDDMGIIQCKDCGEELCGVLNALRDNVIDLIVMMRRCRKLAKSALEAPGMENARDDMRKIIEVVGDTLELVKGNRR